MPVSVSLMLLLIALGWVCVNFSFYPLTEGYYITVAAARSDESIGTELKKDTER